MNHSTPGSISLKKALLGFVQAKEAEALSPRTIETYRRQLECWVDHIGDRLVSEVDTQDLRAYLAYLRTEYVPKRITGRTHPLSPKTLRNVYITLASFFTWLQEEFGLAHPLKAIPAPKFQVAEVEPLTQPQVEAPLKTVEYTREINTPLMDADSLMRDRSLWAEAWLRVLLVSVVGMTILRQGGAMKAIAVLIVIVLGGAVFLGRLTGDLSQCREQSVQIEAERQQLRTQVLALEAERRRLAEQVAHLEEKVRQFEMQAGPRFEVRASSASAVMLALAPGVIFGTLVTGVAAWGVAG